ncbi:hypothetical protein Tco_0128307 [Tanacetum coccineum]
MADVNVNVPAEQAPAMALPTRTDEQIFPRIRWVPIGKSNCYLDTERSQSNPIYKIAVDILKQTNFFRLFTASSIIPAIYIQQFWDTICYDRNVGGYKCQLDEQWFNLSSLKTYFRELFSDHGRSQQVQGFFFFSGPTNSGMARYYQFVNDWVKSKSPPTDHAFTYNVKHNFHPRASVSTPLPTFEENQCWDLVDEFVDEGVLADKPRIEDVEADIIQKVMEESLKDAYPTPRGPLPPVVIREPESGKFQPLPEVPGKGKAKVSDEQVARDLLTLQTPKRRSLSASDTESDEEVPPVVTSGAQNEGQAGPNLGIQDEGQAGPHPGDNLEPQPQSTPIVHVGPNLEHTDVEATDASNQPRPEQMDEGSTGTLSSLQHLAKDLSFGDQFFNDKPSDADNEKTTAETKAESMVSVTIHQDTSAIPLMSSLAMQAPLQERFRDFPEADMKAILHNRMWESKSYQTHEDHMMLYEALEKSMARDNNDQLLSNLPKARKKKKKIQDSPKTSSGSPPPPLPLLSPPAGPYGTSGAFGASSSLKKASSAKHVAWTTTDTRNKPSISSILAELLMDDDTTADEHAYSSSGDDIGRDHIPTVNLRQSWWKPLTEDRPGTLEPAWSIPSSDLTVPTNNWASALKSTYAPPPENSLLAQTGDMVTFMDWYCKKQGISELSQKDLEGHAYEIVKVFHPGVIHLQFQMEECHKLLTDQVDDAILGYNVSKPLPLGGDPGYVTIQPDFFFNKDLEYLRYSRKIGRHALSISKMKAAYYPDVGLEQMVPDQMWIEEECKYDVAAMYNYMKKIVLHRADLKEYVIAEMDFNNLYPSDFEDLIASTPIKTSNPLLKDAEVEDVDVHLYRSMIGSLMYLTSLRPDIMFVVCACIRFQVTPKVSHVHAVKRIFRYLKGQPKLGIWYPKDSPFDLEVYTDSDYDGTSLDKKSTTRGCQFLRSRLISWKCKKQTLVANSTTEAEYVAAANCLDETVHEKRRDSVERATTTATSLDAEHGSGTINRTQSMVIPNDPFPQEIGSECKECSKAFRNIQKLKKRVKKLESKKKSRTLQLKRRLFKGRIEIDQDEGISWFQEDSETQGRHGHDIGVNTGSTSITTVSINITTVEPYEDLTIAQTFMKMKSEKSKAKGVTMQEPSESETRVRVPHPQIDPKDKGKAKMAELEEEERLTKQREEAANIAKWDDVQAMMDADYVDTN